METGGSYSERRAMDGPCAPLFLQRLDEHEVPRVLLQRLFHALLARGHHGREGRGNPADDGTGGDIPLSLPARRLIDSILLVASRTPTDRRHRISF